MAVIKRNSEVCAHQVRWWFDMGSVTPNPRLTEELEEAAESRAREMINEGYHSGELNHVDTRTDKEMRGWWQIAS